jgi:hypothetical protein
MATKKPRKLPRPPRVPRAETLPSPKSPPKNGTSARRKYDLEVAIAEMRTRHAIELLTAQQTERAIKAMARELRGLRGMEG